MPENHDPMTTTLEALRSDVERTPLADSLAVRRRGDQRTRRQAVGGALVVVALVAGAVGYLTGGLTGSGKAQLPAISPTPTVSERALATALADEPFLRSSDFTALGPYGDIGPMLDSGTRPEVDPQMCAVRPALWGSQESTSTQFYQDGSEVSVREYVLRYGSAAEAEQAAMQRAEADLAACRAPKPSDGTLETRGPEGAPTEPTGLRMSRLFTPSAASEPNYYEVGVATRANLVVVLEWTASGNPNEDTVGWAWTAPVLQTALDRAD